MRHKTNSRGHPFHHFLFAILRILFVLFFVSSETLIEFDRNTPRLSKRSVLLSPLALPVVRDLMATKPLTTEAIALTEKKMDMTLDDIIKMSKNTQNRKKKRVLNKSQKFSNNFTQDKSSKVQRYMESRSSLRQGALARRRSNFQGNQFPVAVEVARKAASAPLFNRVPNRNRVANWNKAR
ncbi:hypothetical protein VNO78_07667 [Psophocarpus tetragonolobus]|uniref:Uncharacterized protein n=1 Tax=Psophocarpus tetragonolobus TaxID=3891 RepID=A0AAN9SVQ9_PSOTE